jgi:hypothetical protein
MIVKLGMIVQVLRPAVDIVEGAADHLICAVIVVEATDVESVDNPWEIHALAEGAVEPNVVGVVMLRRGKEGDRLAVAKPHQEVGDHCILVFQPQHGTAAVRDERVSFVNQVARWWFGEVPLLRRFPSGLSHGRIQSSIGGGGEAING